MKQLTESPETGNAGDITDVQSDAYILSEWMFNRIVTDPFFTNIPTRRTTQALPIESWQVPFLGVYQLDQPLTSDGPLNMTTVSFMHRVTIGFQIILANNNPALLRRDLDRVIWHIMRTMLRDNNLTNMFDTGVAGGTAIKGFPSGRIRSARWGKPGADNETPIGEQQLELTCQFVKTWAPYGFDDLKRIDVKTGFPGPGSTPEERQQIVQPRMVYLFEPDAVSHPLPPDTEPPPDPFPIP